MSNAEERRKENNRDFTIWSIVYWIIIIKYPAIIWHITNLFNYPILMGWKLTIIIYALGFVVYLITWHISKMMILGYEAVMNEEIPRT